MAKELAKDLINAGVHFGHGVSRWNPKMAPYIFAKRGKIHIINVKETLRGMLIAKKLLAEIASNGKDVVFVGTKRQAQEAIEKAADKCGMHFVSNRWLGGMLTNFRTIRSRVQRLEELEEMQQNENLEKQSKKQASRLKRELRKIKANLGGVRKMNTLPGAIVVVDANREHLALHEARKLGIPTVGIIDTNSDPDTLDVAIPGNDDSIRAIRIILNQLSDAVAVGKTMIGTKEETKTARPKKARSRRRTLARADEKSAPKNKEKPAEKPEEVKAQPEKKEKEAPAEAKAEKPQEKPQPEEKPSQQKAETAEKKEQPEKEEKKPAEEQAEKTEQTEEKKEPVETAEQGQENSK